MMFEKIGPFVDLEVPAHLIEHRSSDDVGREQIGGELDSPEVGVNRLRQRPHHEGLGQAGKTLQEDVPSGQKGDEQPLDRSILTHYSLVDRAGYGREQLALGSDSRMPHEALRYARCLV